MNHSGFLQYVHNLGAIQMQCICNESAIQMQCICNENAMQVGCTCNVNVLQVHVRYNSDYITFRSPETLCKVHDGATKIWCQSHRLQTIDRCQSYPKSPWKHWSASIVWWHQILHLLHRSVVSVLPVYSNGMLYLSVSLGQRIRRSPRSPYAIPYRYSQSHVTAFLAMLRANACRLS